MLAPLSVCVAFCMGAQAATAASTADVQCICNWVGVFAAFAGVLFFGWGHDGCKASAVVTWVALVVLCVVFCIWGCVASAFYLVPVVVGLCVLTSVGGFVLFTSHMLHECGDSEVSASAALVVLWGVGKLLVFTFFALTGGMLQLVFVGVLVALTLALFFNGLPVHKVRHHRQVAQFREEHARC
jgi:hypothetical protein